MSIHLHMHLYAGQKLKFTNCKCIKIEKSLKNNYRMHIKCIINGRMKNHLIKATKKALHTHCRQLVTWHHEPTS